MRLTRCAATVAVVVVLTIVFRVAPSASGRQQATVRPDDAMVRARAALNAGRYAEVEQRLAGRSADDSDAAALRARALMAVGRDDGAESILAAAAARHPASEAALELGLLQARLGHKSRAAEWLARVVADADDASPRQLIRAGRAARARGEYQDANRLLRDAAGALSDDPDANTAWGELLLDRHNAADARRCFDAALAAHPQFVPALVGRARSVVESSFSAALTGVRKALEINPASVEALVLQADLLLDAGYDSAADEAAHRALAVNPRSPEAHARLAAIAWVGGRPAVFDAEIARALAPNPAWADAYAVAAQRAASRYRFDEAVALGRKALALDPDNPRALAGLGMDLLRVGEEDEARRILTRAFDADRYDPVTYNLLAVLDALAAFDTTRDGDLVVRIARDQAAVLREPVLALAREALGRLGAKYGFTPKGPVLVEVFANHDDFAVRNLGVPGLAGALGACFGRVVTMDSPRARPPGTFEWGATLWHELAHVITLQMSNQRVPRWLTEGISVYEEAQERPEWRRPMEAVFARALNEDRVPKVAELDSRFADAETVSLAYYHAGLVVGYLIDTYGQAKFNRLIRAFADTRDTDTACATVLGANLEAIQAGFAVYLDRSFGALRRALAPPAGTPLAASALDDRKALASADAGSYAAQMALARSLREEGDLAGAAQALTRASALFPGASGEDSPHVQLAQIAVERGDRAAALDEMERALASDPVNVELARKLARMMGPDQAAARRRSVFARIAAVDPFDVDAHAALGRLALEQGNGAVAVREFRAVLAAGPSDVPGAHCDLADAYLAVSDVPAAKRETLAALERMPSHVRAQELLLKLREPSR